MPVEVVFWPMQMHLVDCQCNWQTRKQNGCLSIEMKETPSATKRWSSQDAVGTRETEREGESISERQRQPPVRRHNNDEANISTSKNNNSSSTKINENANGKRRLTK